MLPLNPCRLQRAHGSVEEHRKKVASRSSSRRGSAGLTAAIPGTVNAAKNTLNLTVPVCDHGTCLHLCESQLHYLENGDNTLLSIKWE